MLKLVQLECQRALRACLKKGFAETFAALDADAVCIQETKMQPRPGGIRARRLCRIHQQRREKRLFRHADLHPPHAAGGLERHRRGGAQPRRPRHHAGIRKLLPRQRLCAQRPERAGPRIDYRMQWEDDLRAYLQGLDAKKPVILCGDMNVAHEEIDLKNPGPNRGAAGFSDQERGKMTELLGAGFVDTSAACTPMRPAMYSWWSMRFRARERNAGWPHRLLHRLRTPAGQDRRGRYPHGHPGQRPLPRHPHDRPVNGAQPARAKTKKKF